MSDIISGAREGTIVDGVNLDEIREFAKQFKIRRLSLGLTQTQVGQALSATEGPSYSQSAICRLVRYVFLMFIVCHLMKVLFMYNLCRTFSRFSVFYVYTGLAMLCWSRCSYSKLPVLESDSWLKGCGFDPHPVHASNLEQCAIACCVLRPTQPPIVSLAWEIAYIGLWCTGVNRLKLVCLLMSISCHVWDRKARRPLIDLPLTHLKLLYVF